MKLDSEDKITILTNDLDDSREVYLVLRLDNDAAARSAARTYCQRTDDHTLLDRLWKLVQELEKSASESV